MSHFAHPQTSSNLAAVAHLQVTPWPAKPASAPDASSHGPGRCAFQGQIHDLKCEPPYWQLVDQGRKTFELRYDDRGYRVGDLLILREWVPDDWLGPDRPGHFTGRVCQRSITNVLTGGKFGLAAGYVGLSLAVAE